MADGILKKRRQELRLTQQQLAELLGVSQQTVGRWEASDNIPNKQLKDVVRQLGMSVSDFFRDGVVGARPMSSMEIPSGPYGSLWLTVGSHQACYPTGWSQVSRFFDRLRNGYRSDTCWVQLETLDYRLVTINTSAIDCVRWVDDDQEAMPGFEHEEVYKAASELIYHLPDEAELLEASFPYSVGMVSTIRGLIEALGGEDEAYRWLKEASYVTRSGEVGTAEMTKDLVGSLDAMAMGGFDRTSFVDLEWDEALRLIPADRLSIIETPYIEHMKLLSAIFEE